MPIWKDKLIGKLVGVRIVARLRVPIDIARTNLASVV